MQIQTNTDHNVEGHEKFARHVEAVVGAAFDRYSDQITRMKIHFSDEDSAKSSDADKKCVMEARIASRQPVAVSDGAATPEDALDGAVKKLQHLLESTLGRLHDHKGGASIRTDEDR